MRNFFAQFLPKMEKALFFKIRLCPKMGKAFCLKI